MTLLLEKERTEITRMPTRAPLAEWALGIVGIVAAAVGAYMYYAPTDWVLADLAEGWHLGMFTGAGVLLFAAFGIFARNAFLNDKSWTTRVVTGTVVALAALAGAVTFGLIWIL